MKIRTIAKGILWTAVLLLLCCGICGAEIAEETEIPENPINWTITDDGELIITGSGELKSWFGPKYEEMKTVRKITIGEGITALQSGCLNMFDHLEEITIPAGVETVDRNALPYHTYTIYAQTGSAGAKALGKANYRYRMADLPMKLQYRYDEEGNELGLYVAQADSGITSAVIPEGVQGIGYNAFNQMKELKSVTLTESLRVLEGFAFYNCDALTEITVPAGVTSIEANAFANYRGVLYAETGSDGAKALGKASYSFRTPGGAFELKYVYEDGKETGLFVTGATDKEAAALTIPDGITGIGSSAFRNSPNLSEVTLPEGLKTIGDLAFYQCGKLTELTLPASVRSIGENAFYDFGGTLTFTGNAPEIAETAFSRAYMIVRYPEEKSGWKAAAKKKYGAAWITWSTGKEEVPKDQKKDKTEELTPTSTSNSGEENYEYVWNGGTVGSSLKQQKDGSWLRVENKNGSVIVEQYSSAMKLIWKKTLSLELPLWGGYFQGANYHFLVFGQTNMEESDKKEVMRVVRYSANWHRLDAVSIKGANTIDPFSYGSLRMAENGDYLFIHTCHRMYTSSDGLNHQSNMSYKVYIPKMTLIRENESEVNQKDYVSHSFNQFVIADGDDLIKLDHGDAYPRGLILLKQPGSASTPSTVYGTTVNLLKFAQPEGKQYQDTGAEAGGLEASSSHYLVVGKSIDQKTGLGNRYNIFVAAVPKNNFTEKAVKFRWITKYTESNPRVSNPHLVKVSGDSLVLMWTENTQTLKYAFLDREGKVQGKIYEYAGGRLSDCKPTVSNGKIIWYVTTGGAPVFYEIDLSTKKAGLHEKDQPAEKVTAEGGIYDLDLKKKTATLKKAENEKAKELTIPDAVEANGTKYKVTAIGDRACKGMTKLQKVTVGKNVKAIGTGAFENCKALQAFTLGKSIQSIGRNAFRNCGKLAEITIKTEKLDVDSVGVNAFSGISGKAVIRCPKKRLKAYTELLKKKGAKKATFTK